MTVTILGVPGTVVGVTVVSVTVVSETVVGVTVVGVTVVGVTVVGVTVVGVTVVSETVVGVTVVGVTVLGMTVDGVTMTMLGAPGTVVGVTGFEELFTGCGTAVVGGSFVLPLPVASLRGAAGVGVCSFCTGVTGAAAK